MRFLIGHGGEIAPVDAAVRFGVLEVAAVAGQALVEPLEEGLDVGVLQPANVAEVAIGDAGERAAAGRVGDEGIDFRTDVGIAQGCGSRDG